ncbi:NAD(P)H-hydrate dehydratase [Sinisalibacter aestuarii]|uniref:Bifunctional NAD(P)H-hydrate repair enzyme n=1 Tax=Sinisalibacter aestuarii TaxID=2949426 RepID=A0ABQ5LVV0_9RHOB|nr:NAD(P)H-hydrate dehydratase [Sinisalibacter aestuarii]GKY89019.1 bifunctional NAD(P)H-hydrate repair enzyme [Sinisalibacter aestuarii]
MRELLTSAQMRAIERAAISSGAVSGLELMERAGQGVVEAVFAEWPELAPAAGGAGGAAPRTPREYLGKDEGHRTVVLCGPGNNGGDGFVVARLMAERGWAVEVLLYGEADKLPPDARVNYERWCAMGRVAPLALPLPLAGADLAVDALFGTGLGRPLAGVAQQAANALAEMAWAGARVVAVDAPSGLCMDSGRPLAPPEGDGVAAAALTVSFHALKLGHVLGQGPARAGRVVVADIGLSPNVQRGGPGAMHPVRLVPAPDADRLDKATTLAGHKYTHGHALILSGPTGHTGAARLAARAALRVGAGLVTLATPHDALAENAAQLTAIMLREVEDGAALARVLEDGRLNALALGPGLGLGRARALVPVALAANRATLLDADALTAFAGDPAALFALVHNQTVLTPHAGEFARLFPDIAEKLAAPATKGPAFSKVDATRAAAARAGCTLLFKGPDTVIASPDGRCTVHAAAYDRAAPWLATAGAGDMLAGMIAGLMARGFAPVKAAEMAAWLHVEAARNFGPGLIAEDLPEELPKVFTTLGL